MNEFFQRLKQRKLVQWAIAYVAAAFALLQGIDIVAGQFGWPEGVRRGITLGLVVGFLVTLVLAWYHGERGAQRVTGTELVIIALVLALGGGLLWRFTTVRLQDKSLATPNHHKTELAVTIPEKSIAVLPFVNMSVDEARALTNKPTENAEAYRLYLLGRYHFGKFTRVGWTDAIQYFEQALRIDPGYALAYCGLADTYGWAGGQTLPGREAWAKEME